MFLKKLLAGSFAATGFAAAPGNSLAQSITPIKVDRLTRTEPVRKNFYSLDRGSRLMPPPAMRRACFRRASKLGRHMTSSMWDWRPSRQRKRCLNI